ncbi:stringent starvation protein B [Fluviicoccus keumensis]|uniref:Stringent starvation protein B n=1 Tax=Fluviicoccus keumensis TaxID=1435465 RepID=A0A4Q7YFX7_9GAMM|nr:ClpXP protease specificity-enhancing factor [Fluviicoccus keumensis]RZU35361.1 stringent starvation protein B [Fluviicoccus keumensis]
MTPSRPYLVRAIYEWLVDNQATPYLLLDAEANGIRVPLQYVKDGKIVLNIAPHAIKDLFIRNDGISFSARFNGSPMTVEAPMVAVLAIYARENGQGMFFDANEEFETQDAGDSTVPAEASPAPMALAAVPQTPDDAEENEGGGDRPRPAGGGRPSLRVVK